MDISKTIQASFNDSLSAVVYFVPKFVAGLVVLLIGIILASIVKQVVLQVLKILKVETLLRRYGVPEMKEDYTWTNILAEIAKWFIIIVFLIPTAEVWGLPKIVTILNDFILYLPNVFVAAIIGLVGFVFARISHDVILTSVKELSADTAKVVAAVARWAIIVFVVLAVLNQLGVATDLIRILFTGFVAMVAIAGGIAFGLGGQTAAKDALSGIIRRLK